MMGMHSLARGARVRASWLLALGLLGALSAEAATYYEEQGQLIRGGRSVAALGPNLFGDKVNLYTGAAEFVQTDVVLPGNDALPMAVTRRLTSGQANFDVTGHFGRWELDLPRIQGTFSTRDGWSFGGANGNKRCRNFASPGTVRGTNLSSYWDAPEYWRGSMLYVPAQGEQEILLRNPSSPPAPSDGQSYPLLTRDLWNIACIDLKPNAFYSASVNDQGEGFLARRPDGSSYRFDWLVRRATETITRATDAPERPSAGSDGSRPQDPTAVTTPSLMRSEIVILPTEIRDRFGNTLTLKYNAAIPWQLESMTASDGRVLSFSYVSGSHRIASVSDGTRTWTYSYGPDKDLSAVQQPDGKSWTYAGMFNVVRKPRYVGSPGCDAAPAGLHTAPDEAAIFTHPSGAQGKFYFKPIDHGRSFVPQNCFGDMTNQRARYPAYFASTALDRKVLSGLDQPELTWRYAYPSSVPGAGSWSNCSGNCPDTKVVTVTAPGNVVNRYTYGTRYEQTEGILLKQEEGYANGSALRVTTFQSRRLNPVGSSIFDMGDSAIASRPMPQESRVVSQQGASFSWVVNNMDTVYARPLTVTRTGPGGSRSETTTYADNTSLWVLGQVDTVISNGQTVVDNDYFPSNAMLRSSSKFGVFQHRFTYNTDGTLASRTDGRDHTTYFENYMRGVPQMVRYPDGSSESAVVRVDGLVSSVTGAAGYTTQYTYDAMGRLAGIQPPAGWTATSLTFEQNWTPQYGLPAGHWRQTISKGNARTITYFDAFWRPVMTRSFDLNDEASTRKVTVKAFDAEGRVTFESYPQRDLDSVAAIANQGRVTVYDALGRAVRVDAASELGTLSSHTEYLSGFQVRHTNPRGKQSTQTLWALDNPSEAQLSAISVTAGGGLPGGMSVSIARDAFGKPTSITRAGNGVSVTRSYFYDAGQRLCKTVEPEVGATIQHYDAAGNMAWRAPGVNLTTAACDRGSVPEAVRINYGYDPVNQLSTTSYGDGSPAITRTYWPDGKLKTISTGSGDIWSYSYNSLRLLDKEKFDYAGQAFEFLWSYDSNGSLSSLTYPGGSPSVTYSPNALGEPRSVGVYANSVKFHPNGAVSSYTLGNGIAHSLTQNLRGLPLVNRDAGVMQDQYSYDANGNVTAIADQQENGLFNRAMTYDDLDRLWTANAPGVWGNATYTYDAVDNLRSATVGSRSSTLNYDGSNKLSSLVTNGSSASYLYDPRGNVVQKGPQTFYYDLGNRLKTSSLGGGYVYDGHGRRFRVASNDGSIRLQLYSQAGQILWGTSSGGPRPAGSTAYIYLGGKQIAEWASAGNQTQYVHTDALGSPVAHTNASGGLMNRTRFEPYGFTAAGTKPGPNTSSIGFTGHVNDPETDLVYMQQRYYDPIAGRFLSVDPVVTDADAGVGFGRYTYVNNRPYSGTDPDGRFSNDDCRAMAGNCEVLVDSGQGGGERRTEQLSANTEHSDYFVPKGMTREEDREGSSNAGAIAIGVAATVVGPELVAARALPWVARLFGATRVVGTAAKGSLEGANFAQKTFGSMFSKGGAFAGRSVDDVAAALRSGAMKPSEVPIDFIVRDGSTLILNTRSAQALEMAGVPRSAWNAVNRTGQEAFENMLSGQLQRNGLTSSGIATVRRSGGG